MTKLSNTLLKKEIAIIGLGYVGLPLAMQFSKKYKTIGYDLNSNRIEELNSGFDKTNEVAKEEILANKNLLFTDSLSETFPFTTCASEPRSLIFLTTS